MELFIRWEMPRWTVAEICGTLRSLWIIELRRYQGEFVMILRILFCFIWILLEWDWVVLPHMAQE